MHSNDLSEEFFDEALPSLAHRLWSKLEPFRLRFHQANNVVSAAAPSERNHEPSAYEKIRQASIKRNNDMLRVLGLPTVSVDAKVNRSCLRLKQPTKVNKGSSSSCSSSDDGSSDDDSCGDDSQGDTKKYGDGKPSTCVTFVA